MQQQYVIRTAHAGSHLFEKHLILSPTNSADIFRGKKKNKMQRTWIMQEHKFMPDNMRHIQNMAS